MTMQRVASGFFIFQLVCGQIPFVHADNPPPPPGGQPAAAAPSICRPLAPMPNDAREVQIENECKSTSAAPDPKDKRPYSAEYLTCMCDKNSVRWAPCCPGAGRTEAGLGTNCPDGKNCPHSPAKPQTPQKLPPVAPATPAAPPNPGTGQQTTYVAQQPQVVYTQASSGSGSTSIDSKWLWGLGGLALGVGAGYLIWGNQYKTQYVPYNNQPQGPYWQNLGPYGQVPYRPYMPYGGGGYGGGLPIAYRPYMGGAGGGGFGGVGGIGGGGGGMFGMPGGGMSYPVGGVGGGGIGGGAGGYGLGGNYQLRQPPVMLPPVWN